jgi:hypothetical protein
MTGCTVDCPPNEPCDCTLSGDPCSGFALLEVDGDGDASWVFVDDARTTNTVVAWFRVACEEFTGTRLATRLRMVELAEILPPESGYRRISRAVSSD